MSDGSPTPRVPPRVPRFTWEEGEALTVLQALLGRGRGDVVENPVARDRWSPELLRVGAQGIARRCVHWLVDRGGHRERQVLRGGRRARGRAWDPELGRGFGLRFGPASRSLWIDGARILPALKGRSDAPSASKSDPDRRPRRALGALFQGMASDTGDWVFFAVAIESLDTFRLSPTDAGVLRQRLRLFSPLAALVDPVPPSRCPPNALFGGANARLLECSEDRLARAWVRALNDLWRLRSTPDDERQRWLSLGATLRRYLSAADSAGRLDLARPAAKAMRVAFETAFGQGGEAVRAKVAGTAGLRSIAARDELIASVAGVTGVASWLLRRRAEMGAERYGDERYEESQVFLRDVDEILGPVRGRVEGVARALSGAIG